MKNLNLTCPINRLGYGIVGLNVLVELSQYMEVACWPISNIECDSFHHELIKKCIDNQTNFDFYAPSLRIWHQFDMAQHIGRGPRYGFPIFETDRLTVVEQHHLQSLDGLFVTSQWAKDIVCKEINFPKKDDIHVAPLGVNTQIFYPVHNADSHYTTFLNVGKWEYRKGHDILVEAFNKAFEPKDKVRLWMLCYNPFIGAEGNQEWNDLYKNSKMGHKIDILERVSSHQNVAKIMNEVDCGVFPSRAEGWNLELLEMMACGKQVIATNYSAHTEFADKDNCLLIDIDNNEEAYDGKWFFGNEYGHGDWAGLSGCQIEQLIEHMRNVHKEKQKVNQAGLETAKKYSWKNTAKHIFWNLKSDD